MEEGDSGAIWGSIVSCACQAPSVMFKKKTSVAEREWHDSEHYVSCDAHLVVTWPCKLGMAPRVARLSTHCAQIRPGLADEEGVLHLDLHISMSVARSSRDKACK